MCEFIDRLINKIIKKKSHIVVGLDPHLSSIPSHLLINSGNRLKDISKTIYKFNCEIIDAVYDIVPAIKPQVAFYERYGIDGMKAFIKTVNYGKKRGLIVIEDSKKNDIGSTAAAYSDGHIGRVELSGEKIPVFDVDAITINPYLGHDGILPFIKDIEEYKKGIFVLVKTSNNSSVEVQNLEVFENGNKFRLYEIMSKLVHKWGEGVIGKTGYSSVGAVVGATFPEDIKILRKLMPQTYFLVPGYGAQGGTAEDIINSFNNDGLGALISASRSIIFAYKQSNKFEDYQFAEAAREEVKNMNKEINSSLKKNGLLNWT